MAERTGNLRTDLILAGIDEINEFGASGFSMRKGPAITLPKSFPFITVG